MKKRVLALMLAAAMVFGLCACGGNDADNNADAGNDTKVENKLAIQGTEDGVLTVGMECQYAPYNWTQLTEDNGAVPIANNPGSYANGYDVMIAKKICEEYGWELEIMALEWGGLTRLLTQAQSTLPSQASP